MSRAVKTIIHGKDTQDGAGVKLRRVFGHNEVKLFDPYLMLDFFDSQDPDDYTKGFPWHPHRGIETITFLFEGKIEHQDSLGNKGVIEPGDCQWMRAGSGIIHQEMPKASEQMLGFQLWANLPAVNKMSDPAYNEIKAADIVTVSEDQATVRIIAGHYKGSSGLQLRTDINANMLDVSIEPGAVWSLETPYEDTVFALLVRGSAVFASEGQLHSRPGSAILYEPGTGVEITAGAEAARILIVTGSPINEPIAWGGPIVMNTQDELKQAFDDYRNGTFTNHGGIYE